MSPKISNYRQREAAEKPWISAAFLASTVRNGLMLKQAHPEEGTP